MSRRKANPREYWVLDYGCILHVVEYQDIALFTRKRTKPYKHGPFATEQLAQRAVNALIQTRLLEAS